VTDEVRIAGSVLHVVRSPLWAPFDSRRHAAPVAIRVALGAQLGCCYSIMSDPKPCCGQSRGACRTRQARRASVSRPGQLRLGDGVRPAPQAKRPTSHRGQQRTPAGVPPEEPEVLTPEDVAELLHVDRETVYRMARRHELPGLEEEVTEVAKQPDYVAPSKKLVVRATARIACPTSGEQFALPPLPSRLGAGPELPEVHGR
jgi:hypothetical protein